MSVDSVFLDNGVSVVTLAAAAAVDNPRDANRHTEEEQSPETIAYLARMADSLRSLYTPPRVLELPVQAPSSVGDLVSIGSRLLRTGAVYAPEPPAFHGLGQREELQGGGREPLRQGGSCVVCEARSVASGYYYAQQQQEECGSAVAAASGESVAGSEDEDRAAAVAGKRQQGATAAAGEVDREKAQRARVASCLSALQGCREELESFSEEFEQAHMQVRTAEGA